MEKDYFHSALGQPFDIEEKNIDFWADTIRRYPYFSLAHMFLLRVQKQVLNQLDEGLLEKAALLSSDRSLLYKYVHHLNRFDGANSPNFSSESIKKKDNILPETRIDGDLKAEQVFENQQDENNLLSLKTQKEQNEPDTASVLHDNKEKTKEIQGEIISSIQAENVTTEVAKQIKDQSIESESINIQDTGKSFLGWLNVNSLEVEVSKQKNSEKTSSIQEKIDSIDRFIEKNNGRFLSPPKDKEVLLNVAQTSIQENPYLSTETLAEIYVEQKKYEKALRAYKILSLKYPEKSNYFATRMRSVKKLMDGDALKK